MVMVMVSVLCCVGYEHPGAVSGSEDDLQCVLYDGHWCAGTEVQILLLQMPLYAACSWLVVVDACSVLLLLLLLLLVVVVFVVVVCCCCFRMSASLRVLTILSARSSAVFRSISSGAINGCLLSAWVGMCPTYV